MSMAGLINATQFDQEGFLIAGWHCLVAAKKLGWKTICATIVEAGPADLMRIVEIDENLIRAELSAIERSLHQAERKACYEREFPETRKGHQLNRGNQYIESGDPTKCRFSAFLCRRRRQTSGRPRGSSAPRGKARYAQKYSGARVPLPGIAKAIGTSLDTPSELDALQGLPRDRQIDIISRAAAGETVSAKIEAKQVRRAEREAELAQRTNTAAKQAKISMA
jgi:ParB-like chromosome segregation protein Spo0J